jgi:Aspartyl protease
VKYPYKAFPLSHTDPVTKLDYAWRPALTVFISHNGKRSAPLESIVDTGADHSVFDAEIADGLRIPVREGQQLAFSGIGKGTETMGYLHRVTLTVAAQTYNTPIVFAYGLSTTGILGQIGFFDHFIVTFDWTPHPPCFEVERISRI